MPWWSGWVALSLSLGAYVVIGLVLHQPFHEGARALRYFDLRIYRGAAGRVVHGVSLYGAPIIDRLGFTYPPFPALLFTPLAYASTSVDALVVTAINVLLLVWSLRRALMIPASRGPNSVRPASGPVRAWSLAALAAAVALWLEPVSVAVGYGQIDLLITALVVFDLSRPDTAKTKGAAIGLAAAIKLTPLLSSHTCCCPGADAQQQSGPRCSCSRSRSATQRSPATPLTTGADSCSTSPESATSQTRATDRSKARSPASTQAHTPPSPGM
jgi:hypothetical protein